MVTTGGGSIRNKPRSKSFRAESSKLEQTSSQSHERAQSGSKEGDL